MMFALQTHRTDMMRSYSAAAWLVAALFLVPAAWGQTTGKIAGRVTDAATGDPLPGVNVLIEGTTFGTATNLDGEYVIIGVRPGVYTLVASFIGFATQRQEGVRVSVDLTTPVDFAMREEVIEGEEIVVTADAIAVRKDVTSSEARVTAETIDRLPVQEVNQILNVQAGITQRDGNLHIRGGRASEVLIMVDGVPVTDSYDGSRAVELENEGIQELQVISGTFNAEYGNAMSGVINVVTKEGRTDRFGGSVEVYSGSYLVGGKGGQEALLGLDREAHVRAGIPYRDADVYSYLPFNPTQYYNVNASLEGPIVGDRVTFFGTGRFFRNEGWLYGAEVFNPDGTVVNPDVDFTGVTTFDELMEAFRADAPLVPMNTFEKLSWQGNLRFQLNREMIVNLIALGSNEYSRPFDRYWRWAPEGREQNYDFGNDLKLKFTHLVNARTFYTLNLATFFREAKSQRFDDPLDPGYFGNPFALGTPDAIEVAPGLILPVESGGNYYARGGLDLGRFRRTTRSFFAKGDVTSQLGQHHLVKAGLEARLDRLSFTSYDLVPQTDGAGAVVEPFVPAVPPVTALGYQHFDGVEPITVSGYLQDKMEFENFIVNVGLRLDYFDSRARVPADPSDPNIYNPFKKIHLFHDLNGDGVITADEERDDNRVTIEEREAFWWADTDAKFQLSPRLGIAYPITEQGVIHFSYGHFLQLPTLNYMFQDFGYKVERGSGLYGPFGNPDLEAQKTVMYEIGLRQGIAGVVVDVTGYYRDVRNWVSTSALMTTELPGVTYVVFANRDYANTRGVTVTLSKGFSDGYGFDASYTFQVAEGSNSNPDEEFFALQGNEQPTLALLPLQWDQRHKLAASFYVGGSDWGASALGIWGAGFPYTPSFSEAANVGADVEPEFPSNSRRMGSSFQVDLSAYKEFNVGRFRPRLFVQVYNLFDRRNPINVFSDTGRPDLTFDQPLESSDPGYFVRPDYYAEPRRMHLGLEVKF